MNRSRGKHSTDQKVNFVNKLLNLLQSNRYIRLLALIVVSCFFGLAWFLLLYGSATLHFSYVNWIYKAGGDVFQHQIGWEWFRQEAWHFPLGRIVTYGYPFGTSVIFTDSIPIMAIPIKLLSPLLKPNFQYLGIWELASLTGQMLVGMAVLGEFTPSYIKKILGASLLVLSPPLIFRAFGHDSLTAQWILLAAIWFILLEYRHKLWRGAWLVLFAAAILVHLYFVAMLLPLWAISLFFRYTKENNKGMLAVDVLSVFGELFLLAYCFGLFNLGAANLQSTGFGDFSWNLNGFFNPTRWNLYGIVNPALSTTILKPLPIGTSGQFEGYSYLGLGNLLILPVAVVLFLKKDNSRRNLFFLLPFILVSILFILFALSNKAFFNKQLLWNIPLSGFVLNFCSYFRSSGRFIWPVFYFLVLFGIISIIRNMRYATVFLALALLLQFVDVQQLFSSKKFTGFVDYQSNLHSGFWQAAAKANQHIILIPTENAFSMYTPFALLARQNKLTLNWGYFARGDYGAIDAYANQVWEGLQTGRVDNQTIYIFWDSATQEFATKYLSNYMVICQVDRVTLGLSEDNKLVQNTSNLLKPYCSFP